MVGRRLWLLVGKRYEDKFLIYLRGVGCWVVDSRCDFVEALLRDYDLGEPSVLVFMAPRFARLLAGR